jgi:hypothetical protein
LRSAAAAMGKLQSTAAFPARPDTARHRSPGSEGASHRVYSGIHVRAAHTNRSTLAKASCTASSRILGWASRSGGGRTTSRADPPGTSTPPISTCAARWSAKCRTPKTEPARSTDLGRKSARPGSSGAVRFRRPAGWGNRREPSRLGSRRGRGRVGGWSRPDRRRSRVRRGSRRRSDCGRRRRRRTGSSRRPRRWLRGAGRNDLPRFKDLFRLDQADVG